MPLNFCLYHVRGCCQTNRKICVKIPLRRTRFIQSLKDCMVLPIHNYSTFLVFFDPFETFLINVQFWNFATSKLHSLTLQSKHITNYTFFSHSVWNFQLCSFATLQPCNLSTFQPWNFATLYFTMHLELRL